MGSELVDMNKGNPFNESAEVLAGYLMIWKGNVGILRCINIQVSWNIRDHAICC